MIGVRGVLAACLLSLAFGVQAGDPNPQKLAGVWYGTHVDSQVAAMPLHWKLWRQPDGRFVIDYYVQAGCYLSYSHRELGRWDLQRGVYRAITERIGDQPLGAIDKGYLQRFEISGQSGERMRLTQKGAATEILLTRIPAEFAMETMNLCPD